MRLSNEELNTMELRNEVQSIERKDLEEGGVRTYLSLDKLNDRTQSLE